MYVDRMRTIAKEICLIFKLVIKKKARHITSKNIIKI